MWIILGRLLKRPFTKVLTGLWELTEHVEVSRNSNSRSPLILIGAKVEEMILLELGGTLTIKRSCCLLGVRMMLPSWQRVGWEACSCLLSTLHLEFVSLGNVLVSWKLSLCPPFHIAGQGSWCDKVRGTISCFLFFCGFFFSTLISFQSHLPIINILDNALESEDCQCQVGWC